MPGWAEMRKSMDCKKCGLALQDGVTLCPGCGEDNSAQPEREEIQPEQAETTQEDTQPEEAFQEVTQPEQAAEPQEAAQPAPKSMDKTKLALIIAAIGAVALLGIGLIMVTLFGIRGGWGNGKPDATTLPDITPADTTTAVTTPQPTEYVPGDGVLQKHSYSIDSFAENPQLQDAVVARVGENTLTNRQLQMYYWMQFYEVWNYYYSQYSYYTPYYIGLDYNLPFADQPIPDGSMNWEQYLLELSINTWQRYLVLGKMAKDAGFTLSQESLAELDSIRTEMEASAKDRGLDSADALIALEMGEGVTVEDYIDYMELYYLGEEYFAQVYESVEYTQQDLEDYYTANLEALTTAGLTKEAGYIGDVRHILIMPEGGELDANGNKVYTEEALQEALKEAENIKAMWDNGGKTEALFIDLTGKYTQDTGYDYNGGLYTDIYSESSYVPEFLAWAIDPENKPGDCEIVRTDYGYHIMYMIGNEPVWERVCRQEYLSEYCTKLIDDQVAKYPLEVDYEKIAFCNASFE